MSDPEKSSFLIRIFFFILVKQLPTLPTMQQVTGAPPVGWEIDVCWMLEAANVAWSV